MTSPSDTIQSLLTYHPPVLFTENRKEFFDLHAKVLGVLDPKNEIERRYVFDFTAMLWEGSRIWRVKNALLEKSFYRALLNVLAQTFYDPLSCLADPNTKAEALASGWFESDRGKKDVLNQLLKFQLDVSAVESEAMRLNLPELVALDGMLFKLECRRDKMLSGLNDLKKAAKLRKVLVEMNSPPAAILIEHESAQTLVPSS